MIDTYPTKYDINQLVQMKVSQFWQIYYPKQGENHGFKA